MGAELVRRERVTRRVLGVLLAAAIAACDRAPRQSAVSADGGPKVSAVEVTIRTTLQPGNRTQQHAIVIAGDRARDTSERDVRRLFDTKSSTVTFVDEIEKTSRTEALASIIAARRKTNREVLASFYPRAKVTKGEAVRRIQGGEARETAIEVGGYRRSLWLAAVPGVPTELFAMMYVTRPPTSPLAPIMRAADEAIAEAKGFPMADRAEVTAGKDTFVVEHRVISVARREVPQSLFVVPRGFRDLTPKKK